MSESKANDLQRVLDAVADLLPRFERGALTIYVEELLKWNPNLGLISKQAPIEVAGKLIRQSVELWDFVAAAGAAPNARVADVGSGGGFPGIIWKLLTPSLRMRLIERKARKAHFLERVASRLGLEGLDILQADLRELVSDESHHGSTDLAVMMAVAPPQALARSLERLLGPGGLLCVRHGEDEAPASHLTDALVLVRESTQAATTFLLYERRPPEEQ